MKRILLLILVLAVIGLAPHAESSNIVNPKVILELQPQGHELGDMFYDPTVDEMLNRGYSHLVNLYASTVGGTLMETLGGWLETSGYGVLLYGAHGGSSGETGGETFATFNEASDKMAWLITWQYFTADQLTILTNPGQTFFMLAFTTQYTNNEPVGCDVAVIASCDGASAGDFNAACKLAPSGCTTNQALAASFNCLMSHLIQAADRTFNLAAPKCTAEMSNPPFVFTVSNGDWQLFSFDNPAADVHGVSFEDGTLTFKVGSEPDAGPGATDHYEVEASRRPGGPWTTVVSIPAGAGFRTVPVGDVGPFVRLVEVETDGDRLMHSSARADAAPNVALTPPASEEIRWARYEELKRNRRPALAPRSLVAVGEDVVAYAIPGLVSVVESEIASFWSARGSTVTVVSTASFPTDPGAFRAAVKADITTRVGSGADAVMFVGDANDHVQFTGLEYPSLWLPENGWETIRQNYLAGGYVDQSSRDGIPTHYTADTGPRGANMGYVTPYWMSDWPYVDMDNDGLPDVPITRLPFTTTDEVYAYAAKLFATQDEDYGAETIGLFAGDVDHLGNDGSEVLTTMAEIADVAVGAQLQWLYESAYPSIVDRNAAAASIWNTSRPEIVFVLGTLSNRSWPGGFFDQTVTPPFTMDYLGQHLGLVVALSCGGGNFVQTEDSDYGRPIGERFLAEWSKGAIAWVGPTVGTWQHANSPLAIAFAEELFADFSRPIASSFLVSLRRVLTDHAADADIVASALSTTVLGDPLVRVSHVGIPTAVGDSPGKSWFALEQNVPNPFNPVTRIGFSVPQRGPVSLRIYDVQGRLIATLADGSFPAGRHSLLWDGRNAGGEQVASGLYFYRLLAGDRSQSRKMLLLK